MKQQNQTSKKRLSLHPLKFDQALVALAKTKPEPKAKKNRANKSSTPKK